MAFFRQKTKYGLSLIFLSTIFKMLVLFNFLAALWAISDSSGAMKDSDERKVGRA
jgi:hypothetical protein